VRRGEYIEEPTDALVDRHKADLWATLGMDRNGPRELKDELYAVRKETNLPSKVMLRLGELVIADHLRAGRPPVDEAERARRVGSRRSVSGPNPRADGGCLYVSGHQCRS